MDTTSAEALSSDGPISVSVRVGDKTSNWWWRCLMTDETGPGPLLSLDCCLCALGWDLHVHTGAACDGRTKRHTNWWEMDEIRWHDDWSTIQDVAGLGLVTHCHQLLLVNAVLWRHKTRTGQGILSQIQNTNTNSIQYTILFKSISKIENDEKWEIRNLFIYLSFICKHYISEL